jgi:MFS transporter, DHA1 family, multidrug resistance protein
MHKRLTLILAGLTMVGPLAIDTYLPSFFSIEQTFHASPLLVQQTLSAFLFTFAWMMLFYGMLSDSFGRRPVILISLVVYSMASLGAAFAPNLECLLIARIIQGLAAGAGSVLSRAIVQDLFSGSVAQKILSNTMIIFGVAPALAPVLGGWMQVSFGWRSIFLFLAMFAGLIFLICYGWLPESLAPSSRHSFRFKVIAKNYLKVIRHAQFLWLTLAMSLAFGGIFALYIGSASHFIIEILHLPETAFGWLFIPLVGGMVIGAAISSRYAACIKPRSMIGIGVGIMALATVSNIVYNLLFQATAPWAIAPLMLYSLGIYIFLPPVTVATLNLFPENKGLASSLQSFIQMTLFAFISGFFAPFLFHSALNLAYGMSALFLCSVLFLKLSKVSLIEF